jgi:hypothetical protein
MRRGTFTNSYIPGKFKKYDSSCGGKYYHYEKNKKRRLL